MNELIKESCQACTPSAPKATQEEKDLYLPLIPEWKVVERAGIERLRRTFRFDDFASALAFTNKVGRIAEDEGHHPAIRTEWGKVIVEWWTHKIGGLHTNDFIMAAKTDSLV